MSLRSLELEKNFLGGLITYPQIYFDLDGIINQQDFSASHHQIIFSVLQNLIISDQKFDKVILGQKIKDLGISLPENLNIFDYIDSLVFLKPKKEIIKEIAKQLVKFRIKREIDESCNNVKNYIKDAQDETDTIIAKSESLFGEKISLYDLNEEIENLFDGMQDLVEERGNNPVEETGLKTPYSEYNNFYGGIKKGSLFAIASRPKQGKSTLLAHLIFECSKATNFKIPALFLDTEMFTVDMKFRFVSLLTDVPVWYLETGNWRKNKEMYIAVRAAWDIIKHFQFFHYRVGSKNIDELSSIIRRWIYSKVKGKMNETGEALVGYDYFKWTGEKIGDGLAEHQILGQKIDKYINLSAKLGFYPLSAIQMNRTAENFNRKAGTFIDDSSGIAGTDKLQQLGSHIGIFRRKTLDEIALDGEKFGTHLYQNTACRFQGKMAKGHNDYLKRKFPDGTERFVPNYINFNIKNFRTEERGSLRHVIASAKEQIDITEKDKDQSDGTLF